MSPVPNSSMSPFKELPINMDSARYMIMQQVSLDLMEDFTVEDVTVGNVDRVEDILKKYLRVDLHLEMLFASSRNYMVNLEIGKTD